MLEWREAFGGYTARVGRIGDLAVQWDGNGYTVTAFGARVKGRVADAATGKRRATEIARILLAEATTSLETEVHQKSPIAGDTGGLGIASHDWQNGAGAGSLGSSRCSTSAKTSSAPTVGGD